MDSPTVCATVAQSGRTARDGPTTAASTWCALVKCTTNNGGLTAAVVAHFVPPAVSSDFFARSVVVASLHNHGHRKEHP